MEGPETEASGHTILRDNSALGVSAAMKDKLLGGRNVVRRNEAMTAAQSGVSMTHTLDRDASRQYIDVNFSIGESQTIKADPHVDAHNNQYSQILPRNQSLS